MHRALRKDWLRRNRRIFWTLAAILMVLATAANVGFNLLGRPWMGGFATGAVVTFWILVRESPPGWIENWQLGAWGEQKTAKELGRLPDPWVVLHDIKTSQGNIDHLAIGPGGVFLLDSKRWSGTIEVRDEKARTVRWQDGPSAPLSGATHTTALAHETHDRALANTHINQWVQPVIVVWADFPQGTAGERCSYVAGELLTTWLVDQPARIADHLVPRIATAVRAAWILGP